MRKLLSLLALLTLIATTASAQVVIVPGPFVDGSGVAAGPIAIPDGTCAAPAFKFASDTDTGVARLGANQAALCAGGKQTAIWKYNTFNGNDSTGIYLGTSQAITDIVNDVYMSTIYPAASVNMTGNTSTVFTAIGQMGLVATDTAERTRQTANVEFDYVTLTQSGGAVIYDNLTNVRIRYPAIGTGVTVTDDIALDIPVWPGALEVGTATNHKVINFRDPGAAAGNNYALFFNSTYTAHLASSSGTPITVIPGGTGTLDVYHNNTTTNQTPGFKIINGTASLVGTTVQSSPSLILQGSAWNSGGGASETDNFSLYMLPATAAGTTSNTLYFSSSINGAAASERMRINSAGTLTVNNGTGNFKGGTFDVVGAATVGGAGEANAYHVAAVKSLTAIGNASATTILNASIPNAAHSASITLNLTCASGGGGSVGADESSASIEYNIAISRTAALGTVSTISTAYGSAATAAVTGGNTITVAATLAAVTGATSATQTLPIQVTVTRGAGTATNHTCVVGYSLINANSNGVSVS